MDESATELVVQTQTDTLLHIIFSEASQLSGFVLKGATAGVSGVTAGLSFERFTS